MVATKTANAPKDTIYIDVDDEITGIIDKLRVSEAKIVALVLPKRASVFQSIVNMKLLKRAADEDKKHLVLITNESGLLPLAGLAGVLVAPTLTSKPEVPAGPVGIDDREETVDEATGESTLDPSVPVGALAASAMIASTGDDVETIEMDDEAPAPEELADTPVAPKKQKKDKQLSVPNFERFRLLLVLGGLGVLLLIGGIIYALTVLPKASIAITTDATSVNATINLTADSAANSFDAAKHILPAKLVQQQKTYTQQSPATGQKNNGTKASGSVTVSAGSCSGDIPESISAGTALTTNSLTYIFESGVSFTPTVSKGKCVFQGINSQGDNSIAISAQGAGENYNTPASTSFSVYGRQGLTTSGSASGGSDNITKIVTQADIDNAKSKITGADTSYKQALQTQLVQTGLYALAATYVSGEPKVTTSVNAGDPADNVTVTESITYSMLGVQETDLKSLIDDNVKKQIDTKKQSILDEGLRSASFEMTSNTDKSAELTMQTVAIAGPELNVDTIRQAAAGKKSGEVKTLLRSTPDVTEVTIKLSPFYVKYIPKNTDKITVTISKPNITKTTNANDNP
ncbi:MAG: hypothetical protein ABIV43_02555 [Candidatus Saccharimonadales bacterium]